MYVYSLEGRKKLCTVCVKGRVRQSSRISQHGYCQEKRNYICKFPNDRGKVVVTKVERRQKISTTQPISLQKSHCDTITFLVVGVRISSEKRE